jgi:2-isopropylmalate synthase
MPSARNSKRWVTNSAKKKQVYDEDVMAIVEGQFTEVPQVWKLGYLSVMTGEIPTASVRLIRADKKEPVADAGTGDGPIDAMLKTMDRITGLKGSLVDYSVNSVTRGKDAIGEVTVRVAFDSCTGVSPVNSGAGVPPAVADKIVTGKGASTDIIEASALAYLNALNRYLHEQRRTAETEKPTL